MVRWSPQLQTAAENGTDEEGGHFCTAEMGAGRREAAGGAPGMMLLPVLLPIFLCEKVTVVPDPGSATLPAIKLPVKSGVDDQ